MKKFLSILLCLFVLMSVASVVAYADSAQTVVSVKEGDEVVYSLNLTTPEKVVGCDFSIYYDSSKLTVTEVADFTGNYDSDSHQALINSNITNEVRGNWSILSGIRFDNSSVCSVKFKATDDADVHLSYYVRYLYPESLEQFTDYSFTCDVDVNSKSVIDNAAPELNVNEPQSDGLFVNSVTGKSEDAGVNTAVDKPKGDSEVSEKDVTTNTDANVAGTSANSLDNDENQINGVAVNGGVDGPSSVEASPSQTGGVFTSVWFWVIIAVVIVAVAAYVVYYIKVRKPKLQEGLEDEE